MAQGGGRCFGTAFFFMLVALDIVPMLGLMTALHPALLDLVRERTGPTHANYTALLCATPDMRQLAEQLARGVDPDSMRRDGSTILHRQDLPLPAVRLLLAARANPDIRWFDRQLRTPLFFTTVPGVPTALYRAGADLEHRDADGLTPLLANVQDGSLPIVEELLSLGANWQATDRDGLGVYDYASLQPDPAVERQLLTIIRKHRAGLKRAALMEQVGLEEEGRERRRM